MTKVKDVITRAKAIREISITVGQIKEFLEVIVRELEDYPDTWIDSLNRNYSSYLVYLKGIHKKFKDELEIEIKL